MNRRGSAVIYAIVISIAGILGLLLLTSKVTGLANSYKQAKVRSNFILFTSNLRTQMGDPFSCTQILAGQNFSGNALGSVRDGIRLGAWNSNYTWGDTIEAGWAPSDKSFRIANIQMRTLSPGPIRDLKLDKPSPNYFVYKVRISFEVVDYESGKSKLNGLDPQNKFPEYHIEVMARVDSATGLIHNCHGSLSMAEACELAGGAYDSSSGMVAYPTLRCHPYRRCWVSPVGILKVPAAGIPAVPPACPWPFNLPNWIGRDSSMDLWTCQWCNNQQWNPGVN